MRQVIRVALLVAVLSAEGVLGQAVAPNPPRLQVTGEGEIRVTPDRATVLIGVQTRNSTAAAAATENARRQRAIIDTLKALSIPAQAIATQGYNVAPDITYDNNKSRVTGYVVSNMVRVELSSVDQVGKVIDATLAKGANEISGVQFSASAAAEARRRAIAEAVRNARLDAEALAAAANGSLGPLIELSTSTPVYRPFAVSVAKAATQTPVEAGEQVISASVSATWQFIPRLPGG